MKKGLLLFLLYLPVLLHAQEDTVLHRVMYRVSDPVLFDGAERDYVSIELDSVDVYGFDVYKLIDNNGRELIPGLTSIPRLEWGTTALLGTNELTDNWFYTYVPYFRLKYSVGGGTSQNLYAFFSHNFSKNSNLTLEYNRDQSKGYYRNHDLQKNDLKMNAVVKYKLGYFYMKGGFWSLNAQEDGGVNDSLVGVLDAELLRVNRSDTYRDRHAGEFTVGNAFLLADDHYLHVMGGFDAGERIYYENEDSLQNLYPGANVMDSMENRNLFQLVDAGASLKYQYAGDRFQGHVQAGWEHSWQLITGEHLEFDNAPVQAHIGYGERFKLGLTADARVAGRNAGDYRAVLGHRFSNEKLGYRVNLGFQSRRALLEQEYYPTQIFVIDSTIDSPQLTGWLEFSVGSDKLGLYLEGMGRWDQDRRFLDTTFTGLRQETGLTGMARLRSSHRFWKLGTEVQVTGAFTTNEMLWRAPSVDMGARIFYNDKWFKAKIFEVQIGVEANYWTGYKGYSWEPIWDAWMPIQGVSAGNHVYLNGFINARIKTVSFFLKAYNWSWFFNDPNHQEVKGYPSQPFMLRAGLDWRILN